jgi:hypothetical protein
MTLNDCTQNSQGHYLLPAPTEQAKKTLWERSPHRYTHRYSRG